MSLDSRSSLAIARWRYKTVTFLEPGSAADWLGNEWSWNYLAVTHFGFVYKMYISTTVWLATCREMYSVEVQCFVFVFNERKQHTTALGTYRNCYVWTSSFRTWRVKIKHKTNRKQGINPLSVKEAYFWRPHYTSHRPRGGKANVYKTFLSFSLMHLPRTDDSISLIYYNHYPGMEESLRHA